MMPGLRGTAARPFGSSWARARRQALDRPLRGAVRGDLGRDGTAPVRAEVDDHPGLPRDHRRHDVAEDVGDPLDVHVDETVELLGGDLPGRRVAVDQGCVVDQQVGAPDAARNRPAQAFTRSSRATSTASKSCGAPRAAEHLDRPGVPTTADDRVPEPGEALGQGPPEAPRRPRDHDPLV